jgi:predicted DCC family thiol-disulfide oxidoreductase YuxK
MWALQLAARSPDWLVMAVVGLFYFSWTCFLIGFFTQASAIAMTACCYFFYAVNSLHIGTLSWDILLVTLSLVWVTPYPGDWFSVDSLFEGDPQGYRRTRPFFIQRLLQLQLSWMYGYTALSKITAGGNWLTDTPYYYLMNAPAMGVIKEFPFRAWLARQPEACYAIGVGVLAWELSMLVLPFIRATRAPAIALGVLFHIALVVTMHVPTIFLFLCVPQLFLFVDPEAIVAWIDRRRAGNARRGRPVLVWDGQCGFCEASVRRLQILDLFARVRLVDYHAVPELQLLHPDLSADRSSRRMQLVEPGTATDVAPAVGRLTDGFDAFRRMSWYVAALWPLLPFLYLPGVAWVGRRVYDWVAAHRTGLSRFASCKK